MLDALLSKDLYGGIVVIRAFQLTTVGTQVELREVPAAEVGGEISGGEGQAVVDGSQRTCLTCIVTETLLLGLVGSRLGHVGRPTTVDAGGFPKIRDLRKCGSDCHSQILTRLATIIRLPQHCVLMVSIEVGCLKALPPTGVNDRLAKSFCKTRLPVSSRVIARQLGNQESAASNLYAESGVYQTSLRLFIYSKQPKPASMAASLKHSL